MLGFSKDWMEIEKWRNETNGDNEMYWSGCRNALDGSFGDGACPGRLCDRLVKAVPSLSGFVGRSSSPRSVIVADCGNCA